MTNRWRVRFLSLGVAVAFGLSGSLAFAQGARHGQLSHVQGEVSVLFQEGDWQKGEVGMVLSEGDEIRTEEGATAQILLDQGETGRLELREKSLFRIHTMTQDLRTGEKTTLLDLAIGKVLVHAGKLKGDSKFEIRTPTSTTGVRGTVFEVSVEEAS